MQIKKAIPINGVIVETPKDNSGLSVSGIDIGINLDTQYEGESSHPADLAVNSGIVISVPKHIHFKDGDINTPWDTDVEVKPGDRVWFSYFDGYNEKPVEQDGKFYRYIDYRALYVAVRGDRIIPLNGYLFVAPDTYPVKKGSIYLVNQKLLNTKVGTVVYAANPVKKYSIKLSDNIPVSVGDRVILRNKVAQNPVFLERFKYNSTFPDGSSLIRLQRKDVLVVLKK